jgi:hypothetical protein
LVGDLLSLYVTLDLGVDAHQFKQANFHIRQECRHNSSLMTKFGEIIGAASSVAERKGTFFANKYLKYDELKALIYKDTETRELHHVTPRTRHTSLSVPSECAAYQFKKAFVLSVRSHHQCPSQCSDSVHLIQTNGVQAGVITKTVDESMVMITNEVLRLLDVVKAEEDIQASTRGACMKQAQRLCQLYTATEQCVILDCMQRFSLIC